MKIEQAEIDAAWGAMFGMSDPAYKPLMRSALEAAYRVRKARKKAMREAAAVRQVKEFQSIKDAFKAGIGADVDRTSIPTPYAKQSMTDDEAALRKLGSAIAREFPGEKPLSSPQGHAAPECPTCKQAIRAALRGAYV